MQIKFAIQQGKFFPIVIKTPQCLSNMSSSFSEMSWSWQQWPQLLSLGTTVEQVLKGQIMWKVRSCQRWCQRSVDVWCVHLSPVVDISNELCTLQEHVGCSQKCQIWHSNWVRLVPNWTNPGLLRSISAHFGSPRIPNLTSLEHELVMGDISNLELVFFL